MHEEEADAFAQEYLIPKSCWNDIVNNYLPINDDKIIDIGEKYQINPAIFMGRISFEMHKYAFKTNIDKKLK